MHSDRIGNRFQVQGTQMRNPMHKEGILLTNNFLCNFQNCARALIQTFDQPVCIRCTFFDKFFFGVPFCVRRNLGVISPVHQNPWQGITVQFNTKCTIRKLANEDIRHNGLRRIARKRGTRARCQFLDFRNHIQNVRAAHTANLRQARQIMLCNHDQIIEQSLNSRVQAVPFRQLQRQTLFD